MGCSNCFNGCADIISDKCVKYTGNNFTQSGITIETGDSLLMVEQDILFLLNILHTGTGINPNIDYSGLCDAVSDLLINGDQSNLNEVLDAMNTVLCGLVTTVGELKTAMDALNANYTVNCLTGVTATTDTHEVLQATINKVCEVEVNLELLTEELHTNYVLIDEIDTFIEDFIQNSPSTSRVSSKMIPYVAYAFFDTGSGKFDLTGKGIVGSDWEDVYLCNGQNLTPDLRGRVIVGCTTMGPPPYDSQVQPGINGSPAYSLGIRLGDNEISLTNKNQLPPHDHEISITITDPKHKHTSLDHGFQANRTNCDGDCDSFPENTSPTYVDTTEAATGLKGKGNDPINPNVVASASTEGSSQPHSNIQPVFAMNYIIYIP